MNTKFSLRFLHLLALLLVLVPSISNAQNNSPSRYNRQPSCKQSPVTSSGICAIDGRYVKGDIEQCTLEADKGNLYAIEKLGIIHTRTNSLGCSAYLNRKQGLRWLVKAKDMGSSVATKKLYSIYKNGFVVPKNTKLSNTYLKYALNKRYEWATSAEIGRKISAGDGSVINDMVKESIAGNCHAQAKLIEGYLSGSLSWEYKRKITVNENIEKAYFWSLVMMPSYFSSKRFYNLKGEREECGLSRFNDNALETVPMGIRTRTESYASNWKVGDPEPKIKVTKAATKQHKQSKLDPALDEILSLKNKLPINIDAHTTLYNIKTHKSYIEYDYSLNKVGRDIVSDKTGQARIKSATFINVCDSNQKLLRLNELGFGFSYKYMFESTELFRFNLKPKECKAYLSFIKNYKIGKEIGTELLKEIEKTKSLNNGSQSSVKMLINAAITGNINKARKALRKGASANDSLLGLSPLYYAASNGKTDMISWLLSNGANIEQKNGPSQRTCLHEAVHKGHVVAVELLLKSGSNVNSVNKFQRTPLYYAQQLDTPSKSKIISLLKKHGARI